MKKSLNNKNRICFILNPLTISLLLLGQQTYAMQALDEHDLRAVNAQDGLYIATQYEELTLDSLYWQDNAGSVSGGKNLKAIAEGITIRKNDPSDPVLGTIYQIQTGTYDNGTPGNLNDDKVGIDLDLTSRHSLIEINNFKICDTATTPVCSPNIGSLGIQSTSDVHIHFKTQDGLFNNNSYADLTLGLKDLNIYLGQDKHSVATQINQLVLKNFNFNFKGRGIMEIDTVKGLYLATGPEASGGYVDFSRVADSGTHTGYLGTYSNGTKPTNAGLNLEIMLKKDVLKTTPYILDTTNSPSGATGLIRVGATGRMVNSYLQVRGTDATGMANPITDKNATGYVYGDPQNTNILGFANTHSSTSSNPIMGNSGIGFRMRGEFTNQNDETGVLTANTTTGRLAGEKTKLEIGGAGLNTYGFEFTNLTALRSDLPGSRAYFDSGNVYINLTDTKKLLMPHNYVFQTSRFGGGGTADFLTTSVDYEQNIHTGTGATNPYALVAAIRGAEFQAVSREGRFTNSAGVATVNQINDAAGNQWGLALPFYNLNANMAIYGITPNANTIHYYTTNGTKTAVGAATPAQRLGFSLAMSTDGIDRNPTTNVAIGDKTTSIMVIDGGDRDGDSGNGVQPTDYYMGLRNIDMLLRGTGSIGVENGSLNVALPDVLIVMAGEVAAGYLPGAAYKTTGCNTTNYVTCASPSNNFALKNDVLFGLKLRLGGNMSFSLIPNSEIGPNGSRLNIVGEFALNSASKNTIQISDPADGSILGLDNLVGNLAFNNAIVINRYSATDNRGVVGFHMGLTFNTTNDLAGVFRAKDVNFYPETGVGQRLGEIALTGGTLNSRFNIVPR